MKHIYIVNTCDTWKSYASMKINVVTTSWRKAYKTILNLIKENRFYVGNENMLKSCKNFPNNYSDINTTVPNIYVERFED